MSYLEELLPEFRKGAKIRRKDWDTDRCLYYENGAIYDEHNSHYQLCGFDINSYDWELYQDPIDWDYIIKNKCLCWFWCKDEEDRKIAGILADYDSYNSQFGRYKGENIALTYFDHCRPVRRDEVNFYKEQNEPLYAIGSYDTRYGIYAGMCAGKQVWVRMQDAPEKLGWKDAKTYCKELDVVLGWHLPTKEELMLIYANKDIINKAFKENRGEPMKNDWYWSSSEYSSSKSWLQDFNDGFVNTSSYKNFNYSVRPVLAL